MLRVKDVLLMRFLPERSHTGLAVLRVCTGMTLFLRHGLEKQPAHLGATHGSLSRSHRGQARCLKNPMEIGLSLEIRAIDDQVAECNERIRVETKTRNSK
jgi:hypothetical protein